MKLAAVVTSVSLAVSAQAQSTASARIGINTQRNSAAASLTSPRSLITQKDSTQPAIVRIANGVLIGAAIGGGVGLVSAVVVTHQAQVTDHSEDGLAYIYLTALGAFFGMVVGGIAGYFRR